MKPTLIHLDVQTETAYQRLMLRGVISYWSRHRANWRFAVNHWLASDRELRIRELKDVGGIISHNPDEAVMRALRSSRAPVVLIEQDPQLAQFPVVNGDNEKIARLAFDHLRDKGLRRFVCSAHDNWPLKERRVAFERTVRSEGYELVPAFRMGRSAVAMSPEGRGELRESISKLPKPVGVFCTSIVQAWRVVQACHELGVHVPDDVAVIGCDKDDLTCDLTHPPLSTIDHGMEQAGYKAAELLQHLMNGQTAPREPVLVPPSGVIARQSSDTLAIEDVNVREAMRFIRESAIRGITPSDVVKQVLIGRRRLEIRFKEIVGRSLQQEIMRQRIEHARHLVVNTDLPLIEVARR